MTIDVKSAWSRLPESYWNLCFSSRPLDCLVGCGQDRCCKEAPCRNCQTDVVKDDEQISNFHGGYMNKSNKGFSLLELLIVVAIILIIATIAIPSLLRSRQAAHEAAAVATL